MSNDELASADEIKEYKDEGEEDRLSSVHLHAHLKPNLILGCYPSYHHHHYLHHPPPPAHMTKWIDFTGGQYLPHLPFPQWLTPTTGMWNGTPPHHYLNFPTHPIPSPLSHSLFYSPPPPPTPSAPPSASLAPPLTPSSTLHNYNYNHHHHHHSHHHLQNSSSIPPPSSSTSSTFSSSSSSSSSSNSSSSLTLHHNNHHNQQDHSNSSLNHIKKPLNAFMLFMKEHRAAVAAESSRKESASINQILGRNWHLLTPEQQAVYYEKAKSARETHRELYPCWTAKDNYSVKKNKKKSKKEKSEGEGSLKKCRARFGLDQQVKWCKPCRRKKKCTLFTEDNPIPSSVLQSK